MKIRTCPGRKWKLSMWLVATAIMDVAAAHAGDLPEQRPYQEYAKDHPTYNAQAFVDTAKAMMGDHFMGYVVALQDGQGVILSAINYGWARTPNAPEGEVAFSNNTQAAWGSVTKVITATAVMRKVERRPNRRSLDDLILDYLPPVWKDGVSEPYRALTIGNLIQHRSGFKKSAPVVSGTKLSVRERLGQDPPEREVAASRKYSNINYTLFDYMPRFLTGQATIESPGDGLSGEEYDAAYRAQGARIHEQHLRARIFNPIGVPVSCNDPMHSGYNFARNYKGPNDDDEGYLVNQVDEPGAAVGGIIISPDGMLKFLHAISRTNTLINRQTWGMMARPGLERCGWPQVPEVRADSSQMGPPAESLVAWSPHLAYGHNGSRWNGKAKAQIFVFPNGMSAVAVVNSKGSDGAPALRDVLLDAYDAVLPD